MECNYLVASIKNQVASFLWLDVQFKQCFYSCKMVPKEDTDKNDKPSK